MNMKLLNRQFPNGRLRIAALGAPSDISGSLERRARNHGVGWMRTLPFMILTMLFAMVSPATAADPVDFLRVLLRPQEPKLLSMALATKAEPEPDNQRAATEWRLKTMVDEHG